MTNPTTAETARELLYRHGLPEDVLDGALALHAQELAAVQRREAAVWGVDTGAGKRILAAADLIDPTRPEAAAAPAAVSPPVDRAAAVCICGHTEAQHFEDACITEITGCDCGDFMAPEAAREVIARWREAAMRKPADRAAVLTEAADAVFALDYDVMVGEVGDENLGSMREAWDLGTIHAEKLLRRLAGEAAPDNTEARQGEPEESTETDEQRADREETERDHARGDHTHCGITCETEMPTEHLRNFVIAKGFPGTKGALAELERRAAVKASAAADLPARLETALTERYTELGNPFARMRRQEQGPDGWPAEHAVGPHHVAGVLRELLDEQPVAGAQQGGA